jgi:two-component system sensor histidine kinase YesM
MRKIRRPLFPAYKNLSITLKLWLACIAIVLPAILLVTWLSDKLSSRIIIEQAMTASQRSIFQVTERLDVAFDSLETLSKMAIADSRLQDMLEKPPADDPFVQYQRDQALSTILNIFVEPRTDLEAMIVYDMQGHVYKSGNLKPLELLGPAELERLRLLLGQDRLQEWGPVSYGAYEIDSRKSHFFPLYRKIYSGRSAKELGIIQTTMNERAIERLYANITIGNTGEPFVIDREGKVVSHRNEELIGTTVSDRPYFPFVVEAESGGTIFDLEGQPSIVVYSAYPRTDWIVVGIAPVSEILGSAMKVTSQLVLLGLVSILLSTVASFLLSSGVTRPIKALHRQMHRAGDGMLEVRADIDGTDEIGMLAREFNQMLDRINGLMERNIAEQKTIRKYELSLLQSQINPHFLNNALENSCGLIEMGKTQESIELITCIARFYRTVLSHGQSVVTIAEELKNVELYIAILNVRYRGRIVYTQDLEQPLLETKIVKLTLQPLIENAIYHGLKETRGSWRLSLHGWREGDAAILLLEDNGKGMDRQKVREILEKRLPWDGSSRRSIGVYATNERLKIHFGESFGLRYESAVGHGTKVYIRLPYTEEHDGR